MQTKRTLVRLTLSSSINAALVLLSLLTFSLSAAAVPLTWTFQNAIFTEGGVAVGSFVYDAGTDIFSDMNVTTSGGDTFAFPGINYAVGSGGSNTITGTTVPVDDDLTNTWAFSILLLENMTNAGGTIGFDLPTQGGSGFAGEALCGDAICSGDSWQEVRLFASGSITTSPVPVPAAAWLFGSALISLVGIKRKK
jgi:hypothetical protein